MAAPEAPPAPAAAWLAVTSSTDSPRSGLASARAPRPGTPGGWARTRSSPRRPVCPSPSGWEAHLSTSRYLPTIYYLLQTLVSLPMDEFNDMLSKNELSEDQLNVCRDIRRRGKNKVGRPKSLISTGIMKWQGLRLEGQCLKSLL